MERTVYYTDSRGINYIYKLGPLAQSLTSIEGRKVDSQSFYPQGLTLTIRSAGFETPHYRPKGITIIAQRLDDLIVFPDTENLPYANTYGISYGVLQPRISGDELALWLARFEHWFGYYEPLTTSYV